MTTKRYLEQIERLGKLLDRKQQELEMLQMAIGNTAIKTDGDRVQSSNISNPTADQATQIAELRRQIEFWRKRRSKIISQIDHIEDLAVYEVLTYRYVDCRSVIDMSELMGVTERTIWRLLDRSHAVFEGLYGQTYQ